jgi:hypothetical protein
MLRAGRMTAARISLCLALSTAFGCQAGGMREGPRDREEDPRTDAGTSTSTGPEACDGDDDDADGAIDEGCSCSDGATQACWPGDPRRRNVGPCRDGAQTCAVSAEFGAWGSCEGAVLPSAEIEGNCIDEDCNGDVPGCGTPCAEIEICGNGADDDCDGLADCSDDACACTDCETHPELCSCEERCVAGSERFCDEPEFCAWGLQDCGPDGRWGACIETDRIPADCEEEIPFPFPVPTTYDPECCVEAGLCCQNFGYDPSLDSNASVGNCEGIVETICTAP